MILVLDSANLWQYIALIKVIDQQVITVKERFQKGKNNHSETLMDSLNALLKEANCSINDLDEIWIGAGPGSYTGLRVTGTVGKTLTYSLSIPLSTFSSLALLLSPYLNTPGRYLAQMSARHECCYAWGIVVNDDLSIDEIISERYGENQQIEALIGDSKIIFHSQDDPNSLSSSDISLNNLFQHRLITLVEDVHQYVPNYLRKSL